MSKLGWIEGKNITIEYRFAEQKNERLPELAADLVRLKVDLIVVSATRISVSGEERNHYHPHRDGERWGPRGAGLVASLARPGGNITGTLEFIDRAKYQKARDTQGCSPQARPSWTSRPGRRHSNRTPTERAQGCGFGTEAKIGGDRDSTRPQRFRQRLSNRKEKQVDAIMTTATRRFFAERKRIVELAGKYRLPAIYFQKEFVDEGGLMSYGADFTDLFRRAAVYVDKILKGAKPADLPVQQATKFEFVINLKAAKQIGLTILAEVSRAGESSD